jgi:hypothetical protein
MTQNQKELSISVKSIINYQLSITGLFRAQVISDLSDISGK